MLPSGRLLATTAGKTSLRKDFRASLNTRASVMRTTLATFAEVLVNRSRTSLVCVAFQHERRRTTGGADMRWTRAITVAAAGLALGGVAACGQNGSVAGQSVADEQPAVAPANAPADNAQAVASQLGVTTA